MIKLNLFKQLLILSQSKVLRSTDGSTCLSLGCWWWLLWWCWWFLCCRQRWSQRHTSRTSSRPCRRARWCRRTSAWPTCGSSWSTTRRRWTPSTTCSRRWMQSWTTVFDTTLRWRETHCWPTGTPPTQPGPASVWALWLVTGYGIRPGLAGSRKPFHVPKVPVSQKVCFSSTTLFFI